MSTAGYSGTPLWKKLGYREGLRVRLIDAPKHYFDLLSLPFEVKPGDDDAEMVHVFASERLALATHLSHLREVCPPSTIVWVSWPKRISKVPTDITEDVIREVALPMGWVDVKVCAVDEIWSGLKLVVRKELR